MPPQWGHNVFVEQASPHPLDRFHASPPMRFAIALSAAVAVAGAWAYQLDRNDAFVPAPPAAPAAVVSPAKAEWLRLKTLCAENMARRDAGYTGSLEPHCTRAEELRERASGVESSTAPGAAQF